MNDTALYAAILGIRKPWSVCRVELNLDQGEVLVYVEASNLVERCPECDRKGTRYDASERRWRHLDTCQYRTILVAELPRVQCRKHGVHQIRVPWAAPRSRFTALFEALVIDWLRLTENLSAVARGTRLSWSEVDGIRARAVERGLVRRGRASLPAMLGVDETSFARRHEYVTVIHSPGESKVLEVTDDRKQESLDAFWDQYTPEELEVIEAVAMDMHDPYIASTRNHLRDADAKIVFDKFHVLKHLGDALDKVRRRENRQIKGEGDERLVKTRYLWLTHPERLEREARQTLEALARSTLRTARAFRYKEKASKLWGYVRRGMAERMWRSWLRGALRCQIPEIRKVGRMIRDHWDGVINAATSYLTNAVAEANNAHIQRIKGKACGFRSRARFRVAILFHLGGLDLYPESLATIHTNS